MPNKLERELQAIHSSIAEIKKQMNESVNVKHYQELEQKLKAYEQARLELLKTMEVEH